MSATEEFAKTRVAEKIAEASYEYEYLSNCVDGRSKNQKKYLDKCMAGVDILYESANAKGLLTNEQKKEYEAQRKDIIRYNDAVLTPSISNVIENNRREKVEENNKTL